MIFIAGLPKSACQNCPYVEEAPESKTILDSFCSHDFGTFKKSLKKLRYSHICLFLSQLSSFSSFPHFPRVYLFIYFPLQLLLLNSTVFAYPQESQNLKLRGGSSLSVRVLCCSMTPGICSSSGSLSTLDVPVHLCVLGGHSFMC